jgi:hypothetical protein
MWGTTPGRPPRACGVPETEPCNKNRRLDQKSEHAIRPVINPATLSFPLVTTSWFARPKILPFEEIFVQRSCQGNSHDTIDRRRQRICSRETPNDELQKDFTQQIDPRQRRQQRHSKEGPKKHYLLGLWEQRSFF